MPNRPLPRTPDGALAIPGMRRTLSADFGLDLSVLPSWLTVTTGAASVVPFAVGQRGGLKLDTQAVNSGSVTLQGPEIDLSMVRAARFDIEDLSSPGGVYPSYNSLGLIGTTFGARMYAQNGGQFQIFTPGAATGTPGGTNAGIDFNNAVRPFISGMETHQTMGLLLDTKARHAYAMEGDQCWGDIDLSVTPVMGLGVVRPTLFMRQGSADAVSKTCTIARISMTVWQ